MLKCFFGGLWKLGKCMNKKKKKDEVERSQTHRTHQNGNGQTNRIEGRS